MNNDLEVSEWINRVINDRERDEKYARQILKMIEPMTNPEFTASIVKFCEWETRYEERLLQRRIVGSSNIFRCLFIAVSTMGGERPCNGEMFLAEKHIVKGITFRLYLGQGSFYRISMGRRLLFQST